MRSRVCLICIGAVVGCGQIYCAPNRTVHGRHVVDGAFSVRGRDLPHGDQVRCGPCTEPHVNFVRLTPPIVCPIVSLSLLWRCHGGGVQTLYIGLASSADITRSLSKHQMLYPPGSTPPPPLPPPFPTRPASVSRPPRSLLEIARGLPFRAYVQTRSTLRSWSCPATRPCGRGTAS